MTNGHRVSRIQIKSNNFAAVFEDYITGQAIQ